MQKWFPLLQSRLSLVLWVSFFLGTGTGVALHHHEDLHDHEDCPIFILGGGVSDLPVAIHVPVALVQVESLLGYSNRSTFAYREPRLHSPRAPPVL